MLDGLKKRPRWYWHAGGKHIIVKDYFGLKSDLPLFSSLLNWMTKGYESCVRSFQKEEIQESRSFRFCARGAKPQEIVFGIILDSTDGVGRSFPLLIAGTGGLEDWRDHWDLLPYACEASWGQMDYLIARNFASLDQFNASIKGLSPPLEDWETLRLKRKQSLHNGGKEYSTAISMALKMVKEKEFPVDNNRSFSISLGSSHFSISDLGTREKKMQVHLEAPQCFFAGGVQQEQKLSVFFRKVDTDDFKTIWFS